MKILVSGFEPFGEHSENPSMNLVKALPDQLFGQINLQKTILPVDDIFGPAQIITEMHQFKPDAVLAFGLAPKRHKISLERIAVNLKDYRIPDNAGHQIIDQPIVPSGPAAYFTTLPIRRMLTDLTAANIPTTISLSAGTYLCNQIFYRIMHEIALNKWNSRAGFIHLPGQPASESALESSPLDLDQFILATKILCKTLIE